MSLKLVLYVNGEPTWHKYDYPLDPNTKIDHPNNVLVGEGDLIENYDHEYKIVWEDDES